MVTGTDSEPVFGTGISSMASSDSELSSWDESDEDLHEGPAPDSMSEQSSFSER